MKHSPLLGLVAATLVATASTSQANLVFQADFESATNANDTQAGWTSVALAKDGNGTDTFSVFDLGGSGVDLTVVATGGGIFNSRGGGADGRATNISGGPVADVIEDIISARGGDGGANITLANLTPGIEYTLTSWHNGSGGNFGFADNGSGGGYNVFASIVSGGILSSYDGAVGTNIGSGGDGSLADPSIAVFTATSSTVELRYTNDGTASFAPMGFNGFQLTAVPEPNAALFFGAVVVVGKFLRRKSR